MLALATGCGEAAAPSPSLLLLTTSGLRADALPCYDGDDGGRADTSTGAAICGLADRGALFVWAFAATPSVAPSAATLLTSQTPREHGVRTSAATFLRSGTTTLAGELREHGYSTAAFIGVPELNRSRNLQLGFDLYETAGSGSLARPGERISERAAKWIETANRSGHPYFVWVHFPGTSLESAPPLRGLGLRELDGYVRGLVDMARAGDPNSVSPGIAFAALSGADAEADTKPLDIARVRVPLIWSPPGGVVPQRLLAPIPLLDVAPTLLHGAGLGVPEAFAGEGLHVGPLPPTAPGPARPIELEGGDELGLILSRRYYARRLDGKHARTALLANSGLLPRAQAVSPRAREVVEHERQLGEMGSPAIPKAPLPPVSPPAEPALTGSELPNSVARVGNNFSPAEEEVFPKDVTKTLSR